MVPRTIAGTEEEEGTGFAEIPEAASLSEVVAGLNALGVSPQDMIDILKTIKAARALHAKFIVRCGTQISRSPPRLTEGPNGPSKTYLDFQLFSHFRNLLPCSSMASPAA